MRVLVVKLSSLGDLFHVLPAVHCVKAATNASIDWATQDTYVELVKCFTDVDRVIPFYRHSFFKKLPRFIRELRSSEYDLILDFQGLWKSAITAWLAKGHQRIGPSFNREGTRFIYSKSAGKPNRNRHAVEEALDTARYLNVPILEPEFPVRFPDLPVQGDHPRVALFPFSRWPSKNWPASSFVELGMDLLKKKKASIYILGGPKETTECDRMARQIPAASFAGKLSLPELGGFLKNMDLVITNDSGPMHMAAALGTPTLALFGPTDPVRTGPYGKKHQVMQADMQCRPCLSRSCRFGEASCMASISPEMASDTAIKMLL